MTDAEFMEDLYLCSELEKHYFKDVLPKVRKDISEWKEEIKKSETLWEELQKSRETVLKDRVKFLEWETLRLTKWIQQDFEQRGNYLGRWLLNRKLKWVEKLLKRHLMQLRVPNKKGQITDRMIVQAREYPIESLIEVNSRGFALCPYHDDKNPSMLVRNGFAYCFSCNTSKDPIALAMDLKGMDFIQAVNFLNK